MSEVNASNFSTYLTTTVKNDGSVADRCQVMIEFGLSHYEEHGDSRYLSELMNAKFRATRVNDMHKYIKAHSNLKLVKVDPEKTDSDVVYKKDANSEIKTNTIPLPTDEKTGEVITWYVFTGNKVIPDLDIDQAVKALIKRITDAVEHKDGRKFKGTKKHAESVLHKLEKIAA